MAFYPYSVKEVLTGHFGSDTSFEMRKPHDAILGAAEWQHMLPLSWQYADEQTIGLFLGHRFLIDTIIEDDYIAYKYQQGNELCVFLMFMLYEENAPFSIDLNYACKIIQKWQDAGYNAKIVSQCIGVENYRNSENFRLVHHSTPGVGTSIYCLAENDGQKILVFDSHECWPLYYEKLVYVAQTTDFREYECLFEPDVIITSGVEKNKKKLASGIEAVADFLRKNAPVRICLSEFRGTGIYSQCLMAGQEALNIWVNARNLITELNISTQAVSGAVLCKALNYDNGLVTQVPELLSVRPLEIKQMHGYSVQMSYTNGTIRNYYLKMFEEPEIADHVVVDGYLFNEDILQSACMKDNGIFFSNGYAIPSHILFYRSYRQVQSSISNCKSLQAGRFAFHSRRLLPLKEFKSHFATQHYWGNPGECYGPTDALMDLDGNRISDISFYGLLTTWRSKSVWRVCVEPTGLYGFLTENGNWLIPPVYNSLKDFEQGCSKATRKIGGEIKQFLITEEGREIAFDHEINTDSFWGGLCHFNTATEPVTAPDPGYYWEHDYDQVKAGKWGCIDLDGNIIVEPQYIYAVGFYNGDGKISIVARLIGGKLFWGAIDTAGKEVIPCQFESLYTRWGDALAFRRHGEKFYGVMTLDGEILAEPQFEYFEAYNSEHRLLSVGKHEDALGVFSLDEQRMIIPEEYDCIDYDEKFISCEVAYTCAERYFDYSGNELDFSEYDRVFESNGLLCVKKGEKHGYIEIDGTVIVPLILSTFVNNDLELYKKGYIVTGERKLKGLATVAGEEILPQKYSEISVHDDFIIASERTDANWCICDTLFDFSGKPILKGAYRHMYYDKNDQTLTVETPYGTELFGLQILE
ncbi:MAG: WG repeat-containing protein [Oscillibacter sp.]|nr:WG repeat-containing protein [Oscillibacter sp.]